MTSGRAAAARSGNLSGPAGAHAPLSDLMGTTPPLPYKKPLEPKQAWGTAQGPHTPAQAEQVFVKGLAPQLLAATKHYSLQQSWLWSAIVLAACKGWTIWYCCFIDLPDGPYAVAAAPLEHPGLALPSARQCFTLLSLSFSASLDRLSVCLQDRTSGAKRLAEAAAEDDEVPPQPQQRKPQRATKRRLF